MKNTMLVAAVAVTLLAGSATAQDSKMKKKEAVVQAKTTVAADKADLKELKADRKTDKLTDDKIALKSDRKRTYQARKKLLKDQVKKDATIVKEKL